MTGTVRADPTPTPRVDNAAYAAFVRRVVRAYARRVGDGDVEALPGLVALADEVAGSTRAAVRALHGFGYSWAEIAARIGVTRSAAHERWAPPRPATPHPDSDDSGECEGEQR